MIEMHVRRFAEIQGKINSKEFNYLSIAQKEILIRKKNHHMYMVINNSKDIFKPIVVALNDMFKVILNIFESFIESVSLLLNEVNPQIKELYIEKNEVLKNE